MVLLLVFMQLTRDLFAIAKFLCYRLPLPRADMIEKRLPSAKQMHAGDKNVGLSTHVTEGV